MKMIPRARLRLACGVTVLALLICTRAETNHFKLSPEPAARFQFDGFVGERVRANVENWLVPAPSANPGMISMFEVRDRKPVPNLVPWAGEFAGKYLISAIQAMRMSSNPELPRVAEEVVNRLIAAQAEDGYLGPFRKEERLRGHWDLWGHYHCMLGLLMWHEQSGNTNALTAVTRAADLVCDTYLETGKRAIDAGSDEMNLSIIHALGWVYRITGTERYLRMMREIEKDWERGGDYLRTGLAGAEFFQTPRPRWESLHNIQGLVELYRITGEAKYRDAFAQHWRSIARWDLRNSGGFSSGEQATGNPYAPTPIETCCTIAWMAMSVDMLSLFGDSKTADLLELATFNAWAGAQHPSGRWCTYNTPMDGVREASAHSIVFQSRHGTPELNCCSVNGPRGWGMLSEWAFMRSADGFVVNWLAPGSAVFADAFTNFIARPVVNEGLSPVLVAPPRLAPGGGILDTRQRVFWVSGNYPLTTNVEIRLELNHEEEFTLRIRIPEWSQGTRAWLNQKELPAPKAGTYLAIRRKWQSHWRDGDVVKLALDMRPRAVPGAREAAGKVSVYRGPILLAADQRLNSFDEVPTLGTEIIDSLEAEPPTKTDGLTTRLFEPMFLSRFTGADGRVVQLCDFASAGSTGTRYWSWLSVTNSAPPPIVTRAPRDSAIIPMAKVLFRWTKPATNSVQYLQVCSDEDFQRPEIELPVNGRAALIEVNQEFQRKGWWFWRVVSSNGFGVSTGTGPFARFRVDPVLARVDEQLPRARPIDRDGNIVASPERLDFKGSDRKLFEVEEWPEGDYAVAMRFRLRSFPTNRMGQLFSAWTAPMDDPLRITIENGKLSARIEAGGNFATPGVPIQLERWYNLEVSKAGSKLTLILDGKEQGSCVVPEYISTRARDFALGGNPHFSGNEFVGVEIEKMHFRGK